MNGRNGNMLKKIYLEITDICNLSCSFCHGTNRLPRMMSPEEFDAVTEMIKGRAEFLYFHLMGEPLMHPDLPAFIRLAAEKGFRPVLTTNGTLLPDRADELLDAPLYKINISLHSVEANSADPAEEYLAGCTAFTKAAAEKGILCVFRLWNAGGLEKNNGFLIDRLRADYPGEWGKTRSGFRLAGRTFLEFGEKFDWPDNAAGEHEGDLFCYALRDQIGILCNGSVVPCCLDADGAMNLGNIFDTDLDAILSSDRARRIYNGFSAHRATEDLCRRCGYAAVTKRHRARDK